jgi:hypothetical protein
MLGSVDLGPAGDFVAGVLVASWGLEGFYEVVGRGWLRTVSMYSPLACLGGIFAGFCPAGRLLDD